MDLFGSRFMYVEGQEFYTPLNYSTPYPIGVDPVWKGAPNELTFYNSVKMKFSIIIGVLQMSMGIVLYGVNAMYRKDWLTIIFEWIPMIVFMWSIFGYMCFLIFYKWLFIPGPDASQDPPLLLPILINMFLSPARDLGTDQLFSGQTGVQIFLLVIALIAVPIMLLPKPFILKHRAKQRNRGFRPLEGHEVEEEEFDFGEIFIHQVIHTIEFTLGSVSNTASYLRLWALSLAHSELATVFYDKVILQLMELGITTGDDGHESVAPYMFILMFVSFQGWGAATIGVICVMESLSAFLHGLRLHWVEFQNKFYQGDGRRFIAFSYQKILESGQINLDE